MTRRISRGGLLVLALAWPTAEPRADELSGLLLLREAREHLDRGEHGPALELLERARVEGPDPALLHHVLADAHLATGDLPAALAEYLKVPAGPHAFRARFNAGALQNRLAEAALAQAGVPLDPQGLPEDAPPGPLIAAIDDAVPVLESARAAFLQALADGADRAAQESVAALTQRLDDLAEMRDELQRRQDEQEKEEGEGQDQQPQGEPPPDDGEPPPEDGEPSDPEAGDDQPGDTPEPPPPGDGAEPPPPDGQAPPAPMPSFPPLTQAQREELLDKLEALEAQALRLERERRARERVGVERDW